MDAHLIMRVMSQLPPLGTSNLKLTMTSPPLLRKQHKNDIFKAIQAVGLDPNEFDLEDLDDEVQIKHKRSASYFIVRSEIGYYVGQYLVGDGVVWPTNPTSWQTLMPRISRWLEEVKQDLDTPDLWAELKREAQLLGADSSVVTENTAFTVDEQREVARRLKELGAICTRSRKRRDKSLRKSSIIS